MSTQTTTTMKKKNENMMDSLIRFRVFASSQQQKEKTKIISKDYVVLIFFSRWATPFWNSARQSRFLRSAAHINGWKCTNAKSMVNGCWCEFGYGHGTHKKKIAFHKNVHLAPGPGQTNNVRNITLFLLHTQFSFHQFGWPLFFCPITRAPCS